MPVEVKPSGSNLQIATHIDVPYVQWGLKIPAIFCCASRAVFRLRFMRPGGVETATASR